MLPEWRLFIKEVEGKKENLQGADLGNKKLMGANLAGADLTDADLSISYLIKADLSKANLTNADMTGAVMSEANLKGANLKGAELEELFYMEQTLPTLLILLATSLTSQTLIMKLNSRNTSKLTGVLIKPLLAASETIRVGLKKPRRLAHLYQPLVQFLSW